MDFVNRPVKKIGPSKWSQQMFPVKRQSMGLRASLSISLVVICLQYIQVKTPLQVYDVHTSSPLGIFPDCISFKIHEENALWDYGGLRWIYHEVCTIRPTHSRISCSKRECFRRTTWTSSFASWRGGTRGKPPSRGEMARCVTRNGRRSGSRKVSLSNEIRWYKLIHWNTFTFYFGTSFLDHFAKWIQSVQPAAPGMGYQDDKIWMRIGCQNLHHLYHSAKKSTVPWNTKNLWFGTFITTTLPFGVRIFALFAPTRTRASSCFQIQHPNMFSFCELVQVYDRPDSDRWNLHQSWSM
jgi:hypothetical protein